MTESRCIFIQYFTEHNNCKAKNKESGYYISYINHERFQSKLNDKNVCLSST